MKIFKILFIVLVLTESAFSAGNDSYTVLLLHCNGTDGSQTFTDSSIGGVGSPYTVTAVDNAQIDTAQSKFGGASGLEDGTNDRLSVPHSSDWDFGSGDFTIDSWVRFPANGQWDPITGQVDAEADTTWNCNIDVETTASNSYLRFVYSTDGTTTNTINSNTVTINTNTWYHLAWVRSGTTFYFFVDGISLGVASGSISGTIYDSNQTLGVGSSRGDAPTGYNGWFDEFRISKGIARWTANFTPPTSEYSEEVITVAAAIINFPLISDACSLIQTMINGGLIN